MLNNNNNKKATVPGPVLITELCLNLITDFSPYRDLGRKTSMALLTRHSSVRTGSVEMHKEEDEQPEPNAPLLPN